MLAAALSLLLAVAQAQESEPIPDEVIVVWGSVEARQELEATLWDLGYRAERSRQGDRVVLRSHRRDMPAVILHDSGWMELREGAFQARTPTGKILSRALTGNFVSPRKVLQAKSRLVERTWPLVTVWQAALAAEGSSDPERLPTGAELDEALAILAAQPRFSQPADMPTLDERIAARGHMVDFRMAHGGLAGPELLDALREVPRERFLPREAWAEAYADRPLEDPDGRVVAAPSRLAGQLRVGGLRPGQRVLELSSESGYRCAVMAALGAEVHRVEPEPAQRFALADRLEELGLPVTLYDALPGEGRFDLILAEDLPEVDPTLLASRLAEGGRLLVVQGLQQLRYTVEDGVLQARRGLPLGLTVPANDRPWMPDVGVPTPHTEEHTPGFEAPATSF